MYKLLNGNGAIIALGTLADMEQGKIAYSFKKSKEKFTVVGPFESTDARLGYGADRAYDDSRYAR